MLPIYFVPRNTVFCWPSPQFCESWASLAAVPTLLLIVIIKLTSFWGLIAAVWSLLFQGLSSPLSLKSPVLLQVSPLALLMTSFIDLHQVPYTWGGGHTLFNTLLLESWNSFLNKDLHIFILHKILHIMLLVLAPLFRRWPLPSCSVTLPFPPVRSYCGSKGSVLCTFLQKSIVFGVVDSLYHACLSESFDFFFIWPSYWFWHVRFTQCGLLFCLQLLRAILAVQKHCLLGSLPEC